jgi:hypothetical protein
MKTAMQELIDELERVRLMTNMNFVIRIANDLLEKEKEQIEIAFDLGRDEVTSVFIIDGEDYYNKKFKQNKS